MTEDCAELCDSWLPLFVLKVLYFVSVEFVSLSLSSWQKCARRDSHFSRNFHKSSFEAVLLGFYVSVERFCEPDSIPTVRDAVTKLCRHAVENKMEAEYKGACGLRKCARIRGPGNKMKIKFAGLVLCL